VCHQSVSLIARHLEQHGIATVVMGCARDIVEQAGVPRFYFSNFPLGHSAGKPRNPASQQQTLREALAMIDTADHPRTTIVSNQSWSNNNNWEQDFWDISKLNEADIQSLQAAHEQVRRTAAEKKAGCQAPAAEQLNR
jgi:hypothetical protein